MHHAVAAALTRTDGVEQADDRDAKVAFAGVGKCEEFIEELAGRIAPAGLVGRSEHEIRILSKRQRMTLPINLGRGRDERALAESGRRLQYGLSTVDVGVDRVDGGLDHELHPNGRGQVEHDITLFDERQQNRLVGDRVDDAPEAGRFREMRDVLEPARRQVVDHRDLMILQGEGLGQVRPDEPRSARD